MHACRLLYFFFSLQGSEAQDMAVVVEAEVPLSQMFGFSTDLRSATQVSKKYISY